LFTNPACFALGIPVSFTSLLQLPLSYCYSFKQKLNFPNYRFLNYNLKTEKPGGRLLRPYVSTSTTSDDDDDDDDDDGGGGGGGGEIKYSLNLEFFPEVMTIFYVFKIG